MGAKPEDILDPVGMRDGIEVISQDNVPLYYSKYFVERVSDYHEDADGVSFARDKPLSYEKIMDKVDRRMAHSPIKRRSQVEFLDQTMDDYDAVRLTYFILASEQDFITKDIT